MTKATQINDYINVMNRDTNFDILMIRIYNVFFQTELTDVLVNPLWDSSTFLQIGIYIYILPGYIFV